MPGISHVALGDLGDEQLLNLVFAHHGETIKEQEDFIGERGTRPYPLFRAVQRVFFDEMKSNDEFKEAMREALQNCFLEIEGRPLPMYQQITRPDGSVAMKSVPPKLVCVGN